VHKKKNVGSSASNEKGRKYMNKRIYIAFLAMTSFAAIPSARAMDPATMVVGGLVSAGVNKAADGLACLLLPSKGDKDYAARHEQLKFFTKQDFIEDIEFACSAGKKGALDFLTQHELYKYPHFIEAIKEIFPEYAQYIKALMQELNDNPKARLVHGFETDHLYHKGARLFKKNARDFSEFYELIKKLYAQVLAEEQRLALVETVQAATSKPDELLSLAVVGSSRE
jgi:hypothetical protein